MAVRLPRRCRHYDNGLWSGDCEYCVEVMHALNAKDYLRDGPHVPIMMDDLTGDPGCE